MIKASVPVLCLALLLCAACTPPATTLPETTQPATAIPTVPATVTTIPTAITIKPGPSPTATPRPERTATPTPRMSPRPTPFSVPVQATVVWSWATNNYAETLVMTEGLALLGIITQVLILDTSNLSRPQPLWQSGDLGHVWSLALDGGQAYVVAGENLLLWDLGNPAQPREFGRATVVPGWVLIVPAGNMVHVITGKPGEAALMRTFDVSDPAAPYEQATVHLARFPHDLVVLGGYGYALYDGHLAVLDLTTTPTATALLTISLTANINSQIQVLGDRAYVTANDGLRVLDVTDPLHPREIGQYLFDVPVISAQVVGTRAYLTCQLCGWELDENDEPTGGCGQGLYVVDMEDAGRPRPLGSYGLDMGPNQGFIWHAQLVGRTLYLWTDDALYAADLGATPP